MDDEWFMLKGSNGSTLYRYGPIDLLLKYITYLKKDVAPELDFTWEPSEPPADVYKLNKYELDSRDWRILRNRKELLR